MSAIGCEAEVKEYLQLVFTNDDGTTNTVNVYPDDDKLYNITFYSESDAKYITVIAKVLRIYTGFIVIKYFKGLDTEGLCPCGHKDILLKYVDMIDANVVINNISSIEEFIFQEETIPEEPKVREVIKVSILGISAEFIHSVIVRLRVYEDGSCCEVTDTIPVDMKVGNRYNVVYINHKDHTVYEIDGVLKAITIDQNFGDEGMNHGFIRHECGCDYHDKIGMNNMPYDEISSVDRFLSLPKECPEKVSFTFDTSTANNSTFDTVLLTDIRGVKLIEEDSDIDIVDPPTDEKPIDPPPPLKYPCCGSCCGNEDFSKCYEGNCLGVCCNDSPTNIPNPCPPFGGGHICHPPHRPIMPPPPPPPFPPTPNCDVIFIGNYKIYLGGSNNNLQITIENAESGEFVDNTNIEEVLTKYLDGLNP